MDFDKTLQKSIQRSKESIKSYVRSISEKCGEFDNILRELGHTSLYTTERIIILWNETMIRSGDQREPLEKFIQS